MELKAYQRDVLREIGRYARTYAMVGDAATAYGVLLGAAGLTPGKGGVAAYHDDLSGVPRVCAKVPTGGGKTLIGAAAVGCIFDALPAHDEVVVWLVPRREILSQTLRNLRNPDHFLRQTLDRDFAGRVEVLSKEDGLAGRGFNANTMGDGLTVFVLSYDSFKNKEGRRAYAENSALAGLTELQRAGGTAFDVDGADDTALISALAGSNPLVVVDESHHAGSRLSVDMLRNLNPRFVLELTATPDARRTNVIAQATARQLKREEMVKLPVVVYRRPDKRTVIQDAVMLQRRLEAVAESDERRTGRYIRPIVLFQAERRDAAGAETYELLRARLVEAGIPPEQVAVRTGDVDEISGGDLMSRDCPIRFIITVEALAEGWDCPFAYVLATVANRTSRVSVEQIVGRVLRQPHACRAGSRSLNIAYVLTSSADFDGTVQQVVDGLNGSGFSQRDVVEERGQEAPAPVPAEPLFGAGGDADPEGAGEEAIGALDLSGATEGGRPPQGDEVDEIMARGGELEESYEGLDCNIGTVGGVYCSLGGDAGVHGMRESVAGTARALRIPRFLARVDGGLFTLDEEYVPLERENLLGDFKLSKLGIDRVHIDVTAFSDARAVDLVEDSDAYKIRHLDEDVRNNMRMLFSTLSDEGEARRPRLARPRCHELPVPPHLRRGPGEVIHPPDRRRHGPGHSGGVLRQRGVRRQVRPGRREGARVGALRVAVRDDAHERVDRLRTLLRAARVLQAREAEHELRPDALRGRGRRSGRHRAQDGRPALEQRPHQVVAPRGRAPRGRVLHQRVHQPLPRLPRPDNRRRAAGYRNQGRPPHRRGLGGQAQARHPLGRHGRAQVPLRDGVREAETRHGELAHAGGVQ